ncbi:1,4-dihydroxy-2-naphthoate polyprenyltransferase [Paenibacillus sp. FSL R5-0887]|uniref:1,4-dihydroxy-2-naphthoate polyprenyltransferase n=1 Tax=Paenibacillus TaxID=44249 RepID=UPI00096C36DE|nr:MULTISPECIES: 1,4-dihydroxy-2-naphthoate polyprenyltransferase [Paenibacillus]MDH6428814.1 1,4-dihydroxy-2-naphthoate octaprenyltransferase [Paenibacillus sp. PastH-4]MDH6445016.1 1,4-dihydroxy-2-naphthoate octaprenyltransferase [Paenibacillus sp. PastF-4]MDH6528909.1 1,4-dihydroxy-2-naphthoate octaprenyltransferase [Paenibacillus sp. PastH-3]OMD81494.1 1,4-dihydroxy-2-naphthoate polyprenyltransferase [Paenibacillus odorifer]OMD90970.1 1,4-dihydroxy-2-naphthoate polyprenyltransferase [Paeni
MNIKSFLRFVELPTKVASIIPFLMGTLYALYRFEDFYVLRFGLMFVSLLSFDMATTAINNYYDFKKASKTHGYGYETHNPIVHFKLKERTVVATIVILLALAAGGGIALVTQTGLLVFLLGGLSFLIGILYSFGPIPISRMPLGELFSGLFMGFVIIFISAYIHTDEHVVSLLLQNGWVSLNINIVEVLYLFWFSVPAILGIAGIMLANNICDIDEDVENRRYTLPVYIGRRKALVLFKYLYYVSYLDLVVLLILGINPILVLLILLTLIPLRRNIALFTEKQEKASTFILAVKNFVLMNLARIVVLGAAVLLNALI